MNNKRILIIGLGLIGGSYAKRLSSLGYEVFAISDKGSDIDSAKEDGVIVDGYTSVSEEIISSFDRMVFALYPLAFLSWMERYANLLRRGTIITDVTGVKRGIVYEITPRLPAGVEFIASHPMAGKQKSGYEYSSASLFEGRNYLITPTPNNGKEAISWCEQLGKDLGFASIKIISPEEHDEKIALFSQLPHLISTSIMNVDGAEGHKEFEGGAFIDLTRTSEINEKMWSELYLLNKEALLKKIDDFVLELNELREAISNNDKKKLEEKMIASSKIKKGVK